MGEKSDNMAARIPDTAAWDKWILQLSEHLQEMLQLTASSVLAGLDDTGIAASIRPVPVNGILAERIAVGGDLALPLTEGDYGIMEESHRASSPGQTDPYRQVRRTPYETARELQKQSELLLRT